MPWVAPFCTALVVMQAGQTPLVISAVDGHVGVVRVLLAAGANKERGGG